MKTSYPYFLLAFLLLTGCQRQQEKPVAVKTLNTFLVNEPLTLDPHRSWDHPSGVVISQIYEGLLEYSSRGNRLVPALATHWEVCDCGRCFTFDLRKEVHFQNDPCFPGGIGRQFVASDVIFSWERTVPNRNFRGMITRSPGDSVEFTIINDHKIRVRFDKPRRSFLSMLTRSFAAIVPREAVSFYAEHFERHPVGTGPFRFLQWEPIRGIYLAKNPVYWQTDSSGNPLPHIDRLNFLILPDALVRFNEFVQKRLHICSIPPQLYYKIIDSTNFRLKPEWRNRGIELLNSKECLNTSFILMASDSAYELPPTSRTGKMLSRNRFLRQALNYAVDRRALIREFYPGGQAEPAAGFLPPPLNPARKWGFCYAPQKARWLFDKAGFPQGKNMPEFKMVISATSRDLFTARAFCRQMKNWGVRIRIITAPFAEIRNAVLQNKAEFEWNGWIADFPDAINFIETVDLNTYAIDSETDIRKRNKLIADWEAKYLERAPRIFLFHRSGRQLLVHRDVKNLVLSPFSSEFYKYVVKR